MSKYLYAFPAKVGKKCGGCHTSEDATKFCLSDCQTGCITSTIPATIEVMVGSSDIWIPLVIDGTPIVLDPATSTQLRLDKPGTYRVVVEKGAEGCIYLDTFKCGCSTCS